MTVCKVYLCQPYSYSIEPESNDAREYAANGWEVLGRELGDLELKSSRIRSSMLCESFNAGVANAKSGGYHEFAMVHSDIGAPAGWLPELILARRKAGADIINAVACIKDERGLTSTAVGYTPNPFERKRRLTVRECLSLPETFTIEHVREQIDKDALMLLPNPGLMVIGCGQWFKDWPGFRTESFVFEEAPGNYLSREISEDWLLGYYAYEHGVKVAATTCVHTEHFGRKSYNTKIPWGMDCDTEYLQSIGAPPVAKGRWVFPGEIDGWLSSVEGVALAKTAMDKHVLEIGSYCGKSTICMAQTAKSVYAVDPHDGRATARPRDTFHEMLSNLTRYKATNVTVDRAPSADFAERYTGSKFDMVFIDGAHDEESVTRDIAIAERFLADDGLIVFHDYRKYPGENGSVYHDPGVTDAVNKYLAGGAELLERAGSVAIVRPPVLVEA